MEFLKPVEIGFRRFLVRLLGFLVKRSRPLPASFDFSSRKYLFIRQDRIGDVLVSTPLIHAMKSRYPNAIVDFLLSSNNHFVLANEPLVRKRWIYKKTAAYGHFGRTEPEFSWERTDRAAELADRAGTRVIKSIA